MNFHPRSYLPFSPTVVSLYLAIVGLLLVLGFSQSSLLPAAEARTTETTRNEERDPRSTTRDRDTAPECDDCEEEEEEMPPEEEPEEPVPEEPEEDDRPQEKNTGLQLTLRELGLLQLAAHDFFNVDRDIEVDSENGELDLSTLLDHGEENIILGGEPRNRENIILFSVAHEYGLQYLHFRNERQDDTRARQRLVRRYHSELADVYVKLFGESLPKPQSGEATMTENLALRTIHDFLPGTIKVDGKRILTVDQSLQGKALTDRELQAKTSVLDGTFDEEFLDVVIFIPPDMIMHIDLQERDSSFADQFDTDFSFEHFMGELEDGAYNDGEDVTEHIKTLFAKGLYF